MELEYVGGELLGISYFIVSRVSTYVGGKLLRIRVRRGKLLGNRIRREVNYLELELFCGK